MYTVTAPLLKIGTPEFNQPWPDYVQQFSLNADAIPELITMLADDLIYHTGDKNAKGWALIHAWRALGQLKAEAALEPILAQLNKWEENECAIEEVPIVLAMLGETIIEPVFEFFMAFENEEFARVIAMDALAKLAQANPQHASTVTEWYARYLKQPDPEATLLNELLVMHLVELNATEHWDDIRALFINNMTDNTQYDLQDAEIDFGLRETRDSPRQTPAPVFEIEKPESGDTDDILEYYFDKYGNDDSVLTVSELDGFFAAIACAPSSLMPSAWLPALWGGEQQMPDWETQEEIREFHNHLMQAYNDVIDEFLGDDGYSARIYDDTGEIMMADEWCEGFVRGLTLYGRVSQQDLEFIDEHTQFMKLFVSAEGVEEILAMDFEQVQTEARKIEPSVQALYQHFFQRRIIEDHTPIVSGEPKTGRNDPCPCGSGKKFKKCCLH